MKNLGEKLGQKTLEARLHSSSAPVFLKVHTLIFDLLFAYCATVKVDYFHMAKALVT